jgi:uncharacterized repeat protein (TIGR01451 family)
MRFKNSLLSITVIISLTLISTANTSKANALQQESVKISLSGTVNRDGDDVQVEAAKLQPKEVITWKFTVANSSNEEKTNLVATGPIPTGTVFVANSVKAQGSFSVQYSADGGQTFSDHPTKRNQKGDMIVVSPSEFTHVRVTVERLAANATVTGEYKTRLR